MKLAILAAAVLISVSGQGIAARQFRAAEQTAVGVCQAASPAFEGAFRKRPLAIANEGDSTAFVSCGLTTERGGSLGLTNVSILFTNKGATSVNVSCTLVTGLGSTFELTKFFPRTFLVGTAGPLVGAWASVGDNGGTPFKTSSISCAIPPNVEINATATAYEVEVGL